MTFISSTPAVVHGILMQRYRVMCGFYSLLMTVVGGNQLTPTVLSQQYYRFSEIDEDRLYNKAQVNGMILVNTIKMVVAWYWSSDVSPDTCRQCNKQILVLKMCLCDCSKYIKVFYYSASEYQCLRSCLKASRSLFKPSKVQATLILAYCKSCRMKNREQQNQNLQPVPDSSLQEEWNPRKIQASSKLNPDRDKKLSF